MEPYAAVSTTGIYCRPGCGARPRPDHVTHFPLAAAAEAAGYRACLRCRPYRTSRPLSANAPEVVCRAVRLILDGALDRGGESDLAARLAVSSRHLRRLFVAHLGVTPIALARSVRAHFARRLLDDTDLSVTEIAFASGFRSLRQFNRVVQEVFHDSPRRLRERRRAGDRLAADGGLPLRLPFAGPLDWAALCTYLKAHAIPGVESVEDEVYRRTILVEGSPGVLEIASSDGDCMLLTVHLPHWDELVHLVERARRIPNLDFAVDPALAGLQRDPLVGALLRAHPGVRTPGTWDPVETGVRVILGQGRAAADANELAGRLVVRTGRPVPGLAPLRLSHCFPPAQTLATADLEAAGVSRPQARSVRAFARAVLADRIRLDGSVSLGELVDSLTAVEGIGEFAANHLALRLGEADASPTAGLEQGLLDAPLAVDAAAERWRPWRALAVMHLWLAAGDAGRGQIAA